MSESTQTNRAHIADRLNDAIFLIQNGRTTAAVAMIAIAIDAIARYEYPSLIKSYDRYIAFLDDGLHIITLLTSGIGVSGQFKFAGMNLEGVKRDEEGMITFQDLIYSFLRCSIIHEGKINYQLILQESATLFEQDDKSIKVSPKLVDALLIAAITSPSNVGINPGPYEIGFIAGSKPLPAKKLAGKRKAVLRMLQIAITRERQKLAKNK